MTYTTRRPVKRYRRGPDWGFIGYAAIIATVILGGVGFTVAQQTGNQQTQICTVTERDRVSAYGQQGKSDMRIYTEECGVLGVGDVLLKGIFNSADTYGQIEPGQTYEFTTVGYRIPLLSQFPTIIEVENGG